MTFLLGMVTAFAGMACLACTQDKQAKVIYGGKPGTVRKRTMALAGTTLLLVTAWQTVMAYGLGIGLVTFFSHACFAAWLVVVLLTWRRNSRPGSVK